MEIIPIIVSLIFPLLYCNCSASAIQAAPKRAKVAVRNKENSKRELILGDLGMKKVAVKPMHDSSGVGGDGEGDGEGDEGGFGGQKLGKGKAPGKQKVQMKVVRQSFAVGGLDQEYMDWGMGASGTAATQGGSKGGMTKTQIRQAARERPFTDFDASKKLKKGGKVGVKAFKSKSKFKRR